MKKFLQVIVPKSLAFSFIFKMRIYETSPFDSFWFNGYEYLYG